MEKDITKTIKLSREQFFTLLKAVYLGNWVANGYRDGSMDDPHVEEYEKIEDFIFSFAKQFGFGEYVDCEEAEKGKFYPTRAFEEETDVQELIDESDEESFWYELTERLAERDLVREYGVDAVQTMERDVRFSKLCELTDKWSEELEQYGLERLDISK